MSSDLTLALRMAAAVAELANSPEGKAILTQLFIKADVPVEKLEAHVAMLKQAPPPAPDKAG